MHIRHLHRIFTSSCSRLTRRCALESCTLARHPFATSSRQLNSTSFMGDRNDLQADRTKGLEDSVWVEFIALANKHQAVNLGQGFPDYEAPAVTATALKDVAERMSSDPRLFQYTRGFGHPRLVQAMSTLYSKLLSRPVDPMAEVLVTIGAYNALFYSVFGLLNPGDEAIIIEPFYDCYEPITKMAGGIPKFVALELDKDAKPPYSTKDLRLDFDKLEAAFSDRTKILFFNNPHNPTGKVFSREELLRVAALAEKYNVTVLADEVYEWLVYPSSANQMIRFATLPGMWERTITIGSAGKTFSSTGWKVGWAIGPERILKNLRYVSQQCIFTAVTPIQEALAISFESELARLDSPECYFNSITEELKPKRDLLAASLTAAGLRPIIPEGGYFMMAEYTHMLNYDKFGSQFHEINDKYDDRYRDYRFVKWLTSEKKLATIPTTAFYSEPSKKKSENFVRFCFFKKDETIKAAANILQSLS